MNPYLNFLSLIIFFNLFFVIPVFLPVNLHKPLHSPQSRSVLSIPTLSPFPPSPSSPSLSSPSPSPPPSPPQCQSCGGDACTHTQSCMTVDVGPSRYAEHFVIVKSPLARPELAAAFPLLLFPLSPASQPAAFPSLSPVSLIDLLRYIYILN